MLMEQKGVTVGAPSQARPAIIELSEESIRCKQIAYSLLANAMRLKGALEGNDAEAMMSGDEGPSPSAPLDVVSHTIAETANILRQIDDAILSLHGSLLGAANPPTSSGTLGGLAQQEAMTRLTT